MMRRVIKILPIFLIALIFTGCEKEEVTYRTLKEIQESGIVNIAFSTDRYSFMNKDTDADQNEIDKNNDKIYLEEEVLIGSFVARNGVKVNLIKTTRDNLVNLILDGSADMAFGKVEKSESDKFKVNQSLIFAKEEPYIITNKGVNVFSLQDLANKKVAIISGNPLANLVKNDLSGVTAEIKQYKKLDTAIEQLLSYNVDAVICYQNDADKIFEQNTDTLSLNTFSDGEYLKYVALVAKDNDTLLTEINDVINEYFYPTQEEEEII